MSIEEEGLSLSKETLRALKEFAQSSGINYNDNSDDEEEDDKNGKSIIKNITKHFDVKDKYDIFHLLWENQDIKIELHLKGIKRELGQTLASTGLTM